MRLVQPLPRGRSRTLDGRAVRPPDAAREPFLDVLPQPLVLDELRGLGALGCLLSLPLRHPRPVLQLPAPSGGVAAKLTRNRPRVTTDRPRDLAHPLTSGAQDRDLLTLLERQVTARGLGQTDRWHAASVTKPARAHRHGHAHPHRSLGRGDARGDQPPELSLHRPRRLGSSRRTHRRAQRPIRTPLPTKPLRYIAGLRAPVARRHP